MPDCFVIGDVHDHYDRLFDLLVEAGLLDPLTHRRLNADATVVSLGDLGHFGEGSSPGARLCYQAVRDGWIDVVLWGNHDRGVVDGQHQFLGYQRPDPDLVMLLGALAAQGVVRMAYASHGHLLTHAGLHAAFADQPDMNGVDKRDPEQVAAYINDLAVRELPGPNAALWDAVGEDRGGPPGAAGGILWRHWTSPMFDAFAQVCGHSAGADVRARVMGSPADHPDPRALIASGAPAHVCVDVGQVDNGRLAGLWLGSREIVLVDRPDWGVTARR